jgi:YVTN family beta-propeller protein
MYTTNSKTRREFVYGVRDFRNLLANAYNDLIKHKSFTIPVGSAPIDIDVNPVTNMIYVANQDSNSLSIINGSSNQLVFGIAVSVIPSNEGDAYCNNNKILNNYALYDNGTSVICEVEINSTFSTIPIIGEWLESTTKGSLRFSSWHGLINSADNPVKFNISQFGVLTANLRQDPPLMPEWLLTTIVYYT